MEIQPKNSRNVTVFFLWKEAGGGKDRISGCIYYGG
jgi:hypothetical protein